MKLAPWAGTLLRVSLALSWLAFGTRGWLWAAGGLSDEHVYNFRGKALPADIVPFGPDANRFFKPEADGLRVTLPRDRDSLAPLGLSMRPLVQGDFEITATFEILQADEPPPEKPSYGVGALMSVNDTARIGRLARAAGVQVVSWDRWGTREEDRVFLFGASPCNAKVVRLRLTRSGTILSFLWAPEGTGDEFNQFYQCEFGYEDITALKLEFNADMGGEAGALDARVLDLRIRAEGEAGWVWRLAQVGLCILVGGGLLAGWYLNKRKRRANRARGAGLS